MLSLLARIGIKAVTIAFLLPYIPGIAVHGGFGTAVIGTLGLALLVIVPFWVLGLWLLPAIALRTVADLMPSAISISGWTPAIWGGLVLLIISMLTGGMTTLGDSVARRRPTVV